MTRVAWTFLILGALACSGAGTTDTVDTGQPCADAPLAPPSDISAGDALQQAIMVTWTAPEGAAGYIVERSDAEAGEFAEIGRTIDTEFRDTGLGDGVTKYYRVIAANADGESCPSEVAMGQTREASAATTDDGNQGG